MSKLMLAILEKGGTVLALDDFGLWFNDRENSTHLIVWSKVEEGMAKIERCL